MIKVFKVTLQGKTTGLVHYDYYLPTQLERLTAYTKENAAWFNATVTDIVETTAPNDTYLSEIAPLYEEN